jgi:hypothetical protein
MYRWVGYDAARLASNNPSVSVGLAGRCLLTPELGMLAGRSGCNGDAPSWWQFLRLCRDLQVNMDIILTLVVRTSLNLA